MESLPSTIAMSLSFGRQKSSMSAVQMPVGVGISRRSGSAATSIATAPAPCVGSAAVSIPYRAMSLLMIRTRSRGSRVTMPIAIWSAAVPP